MTGRTTSAVAPAPPEPQTRSRLATWWPLVPLVAGVAAVCAAVVADLGLLPYVLGAAAVVVGLGALILRSRLAITSRLVGAIAAALAVAVAATLAVTGLPHQADSWDIRDTTAPGLSGTATRQGDLLFADDGAWDVRTGQVRWQAEGDDPGLVAVTPSVVVQVEKGSDGTGRLVGHDPVSGRTLWSVEASEFTRGIAYDGDTLVTAQVAGDGSGDVVDTVAVDLASGATTWHRAGQPVMECEQGLLNGNAAALSQPLVLIADEPGFGPGTTVRAYRVSDGETVTPSLPCLGSVRTIGDTVVSTDEDSRVAGLSASTGEQLWLSDPVPATWNLAGAGERLYSSESTYDAHGRSTTDYVSLDVLTGRTAPTAPPEGWSVGVDDTRGQRGAAVWMPVVRGSEVGMWRLGSDQVVTVPGAVGSVGIAEADRGSGWLALTGRTEDILGRKHPQSWALSPDGDLFGPFPGQQAWVADGLISVDGRLYPAP